jgi:hypothetical protein
MSSSSHCLGPISPPLSRQNCCWSSCHAHVRGVTTVRSSALPRGHRAVPPGAHPHQERVRPPRSMLWSTLTSLSSGQTLGSMQAKPDSPSSAPTTGCFTSEHAQDHEHEQDMHKTMSRSSENAQDQGNESIGSLSYFDFHYSFYC